MELKICKRCGIEKELSSYYSGFDKRRNRPYIFAICKSCHRIRDAEWKKNNPERIKEIQKKSQRKNRSKYYKTQYEKWKKNWIARSHRRKNWPSNNKTHRYKLANSLIKDQNNSCAICSISFSEVSYDIDHNHETGLIRGLLCRKCNSGLHYFENKSFIEKAKKYLSKYPAQSYPATKY